MMLLMMMVQIFSTTVGQHTDEACNKPVQPSCSLFGVPTTGTNVGELLQLQTTLAVIEHRSVSSTSSASSKSKAQDVTY